ncbi:signal peptidase I [Kiritimatiellota bacterium B12222]|nr:signal peptidase I [Kiritimatiellota bacterium B12222]
MNLFQSAEQKKQRKHIEHAIFQVKYARRMKDDLITAEIRDRLWQLQVDLKAHLKSKHYAEGVALADNASALARDVHPAPRKAYALRENVEVIVVVLAVALGFRTYFFQPYQIPTGSMQPTLYGITAQAEYEPNWTDKVPVRFGKFLLTGSRYKSIEAKAAGVMPGSQFWKSADTYYVINIGGKNHKIHKDMIFEQEPSAENNWHAILNPWFPEPGTRVQKGDVIAKGLLKQGDHIIVNRVSVNFVRPSRGNIVVFSTTGLPLVRANSAYIKRLTGLPGETISIRDGRLIVDGEVVDEPWQFERQYEDENYSGYSNPSPQIYARYHTAPLFADPSSELLLGEDEFLMMGDNTYHSLDGRYFGGVPAKNIIGTGVFVPWPFFNRGIHDDKAGFVY